MIQMSVEWSSNHFNDVIQYTFKITSFPKRRHIYFISLKMMQHQQQKIQLACISEHSNEYPYIYLVKLSRHRYQFLSLFYIKEWWLFVNWRFSIGTYLKVDVHRSVWIYFVIDCAVELLKFKPEVSIRLNEITFISR